MSFIVTHRYGSEERVTDLAVFSALLSELDDRPDDTEHGSVAVTHESEWCISVSRGGYAILEHLEDGGECHMRDLSDQSIFELWNLLAVGNIEALREKPWKPGYQ